MPSNKIKQASVKMLLQVLSTEKMLPAFALSLTVAISGIE